MGIDRAFAVVISWENGASTVFGQDNDSSGEGHYAAVYAPDGIIRWPMYDTGCDPTEVTELDF